MQIPQPTARPSGAAAPSVSTTPVASAPSAAIWQTIAGVDVLIEGAGPHTVLMVHGWPDSLQLWDNTASALQGQYRCVRFTLPGFDLGQGRPSGHSGRKSTGQATSLADMVALIASIANAVSPNAPVTLLLHDWGCIFGYEFANRHPTRVARVLAVDIGDHNSGTYIKSLSATAKLSVFVYQFWLAVAWQVGRYASPSLADRMTRWMAHTIGCRTEPSSIGWAMNYPYAMTWFQTAGGFKLASKVKPIWPMLYIYGKRKPFMFQSPQWLADVAARTHCEVQAFDTGHWVMVQKPAEFNACVSAWLDKTRVLAS